MPPHTLNEREFELINIVGGQLAANQRALSRHMKISLGMTNMLLRRLVTKGYIRIKQLDHRKVEYILTPKGFSEKMRKSLNYTQKTINSIALVRSRLSTILKGLYGEGIRTFYILGGVDLAGLIEMTMKEDFPLEVKVLRINEMPIVLEEGVILVCSENISSFNPKIRVVDVIQELAKDGVLHG
jgi:DNA-binding MarR family transcriptional regulator